MQVQAQEKIWNSKFIFSWLANFFAFTTMYYLMSTIPLYTTEILEGNKSDVGMLFALYAVWSSGTSLGRASAGFLQCCWPWLGLTVLHSFDYDVMFLVVSVIAALSCACLLGIRYEGKAVKGGQAGGFLERKILPYAIIVFFMAVGYSAILSFIVLFSQELGIENASIFFFVNAIAVIISRPCAGKMQTSMARLAPCALALPLDAL